MRSCILIASLLLVSCFCKDTSYLRRLEEYDPESYTIAMCGSFKNACVNRYQEKNILGGKEGEFPTKFTAEYYRFSADECYDSSLIYTVTASGPMSNHKTLGENNFSADISINTRTITFAQDPAQYGIECDNVVELNKEYSTSELPCFSGSFSLYKDYMDVGEYHRDIYVTGTYIEYNNDNSTRIDSFSITEQCEMKEAESDPTTLIWICIAALIIVAIIGMLIINMCVEKKSKKTEKKKDEKKKTEKKKDEKKEDEKKEDEEYSDYSDYSDEEEKKEEKKVEVKMDEKVEVKMDEKEEEEKKDEKKEEVKKDEKKEEVKEEKKEEVKEEKKEEVKEEKKEVTPAVSL